MLNKVSKSYSILQEVIAYYQQQVDKLKKDLSAETQRIYRVGTLRLILFVAGVVAFFYFYGKWGVVALLACLTFLPFILLIKVHNRMFARRDYLSQALKVNEQELKVIHDDPSDFDGGADEIDASHSFTFDIDVFGNKSLFQYANRTVTSFGRTLLADWFKKPFDSAESICRRQQTLGELASKRDFRQTFRVTGLLYKGNASDGNEFLNWNCTENYFNSRRYYGFIKWVVPAVNALLIVLACLGFCSYMIPCLSVACFIILSIALGKRISKEQASFDEKLRILHTYGRLFSLIDQEDFECNEMKGIKAGLKKEDMTATEAIRELSDHMNALDQRNNIFVTAILNGLFFWELHQIMKIERWKDRYGTYLSQWLECLGEVDALCSLATYVYNHPSFVFPRVSAVPLYQAKDLRHPLMRQGTCVPNDVDMAGTPCFSVITGANMAGKSTYLRTVGINHLLGCMGMPVDAAEMTFFPAHLVTSLRTNDSLNENESYFFAELKRLKMIVDKLQQGEQLFIILDEILRGTNSVDKQKGSYSFVKQLVLHQATGLIATHDLQLAKLKDVFPQAIRTQCFEADMKDGELTFSYRLRDGIAQNMNACFLMKKMGIEIEDLPQTK